MNLHDFCSLEYNLGKKGRSYAWDGVYESLKVQERDELQADQGNFVYEMTNVHQENLERSRRGVDAPIVRKLAAEFPLTT